MMSQIVLKEMVVFLYHVQRAKGGVAEVRGPRSGNCKWMLIMRCHAADVQIECDGLIMDHGASLKCASSPMSVKDHVIRNCRF